MKKEFRKTINYTSDSDKYWESNWSNEKVENQVEALKWSGYIPIFKKYIKNSDLILENGCGLGSAVQYFINKKQKIVGLDFNFATLNRLKHYKNDAQLINGNSFLLPFNNETFDGCLSLGVIEHFEGGADGILLEMKRIIKKNGLLFISVPYYNLIRRIGLNCFENKGIFYQFVFSKKELERLLKKHFNIINFYYCNKLRFLYQIYTKYFKPLIAKKKNNFTKTTNQNKSHNNKSKKNKYFDLADNLIPPFLSSSMIVAVVKKP